MSASDPTGRGSDEQTVVDTPARAAGVNDEPAPGAVVGRYVVVESVGVGAMGRVLRAYDPRLRREVAIKRVRAELRGDEGHVRLLREARAMARLSHPNVVAVYDAEELPGGVALAMEFIAGGTLGDWLHAASRTASEILDVLRDAGEGLAAAHRVGLVHRDFKPANVLVSDDGRVKVSDFGLAKPIGHSIDGQSAARAEGAAEGEADEADEVDDEALTRVGTVMGTPRYMSPEQHAGRDADARADQYAYCVTLWEALCGRAPFRETTVDTLAREKYAGPPAWPREVTMPRRVVDVLRRGLDVEPDRRWPTMSELLSALDRARGHARRRRLALGGVAIVLLATGGLGARALDRNRRAARCEALGSEIDSTWPDRREAVHAGIVGSGLPYAEATWAASMPWLDSWARDWADARTDTCVASEIEDTLPPHLHARAAACLDLARVKVDTVLERLEAGDPEAIQGAVSALAAPAELDACRDPARLQRAQWPEPDRWDEVVALRRRLSRASGLQAAGRYADAESEARDVLEAARSLEFAPLEADAALRLGIILDRRAQLDEAETSLRGAYFQAARAGAERTALAAASQLVFTVGHRRARPDDGLEWAEHARVHEDRLEGEEPLMSATLLNNLATVQRARGRHQAAMDLHARALAIREEVLGPQHPDVATSLNNSALVHADAAAYEDAAALHERALVIREHALGPEHPAVASSLDNLAGMRRALGAHEEAERLYERALVIWERALGPAHPSVAICLNGLAVVELALGAGDDAAEHAARSLAIREKALGPDHPDVAMSLDVLAGLRWDAGERTEAIAMRERALAIRVGANGPEHPHVAATLGNLAALQLGLGELAKAREGYARCLTIWAKAMGPDHVNASHCIHGLAEVALEQGEAREALELADRALALHEKASASASTLASAKFLKARALAAAGQRTLALASAREALDTIRDKPTDSETRVEIEAWLDAHDTD